jgi:hypothetical protein
MKKIFFSLMFILIATLGFSQNSKIDKDYSSLILGNWKLREAASDGVNKGFAMYGDDYYGESFYRDNGTSTHLSLYKTSWKIDKNVLLETLLEDNGQSGTGEIWTKYEILILDDTTLTLKVIERHGNTSYSIDNAPELTFKRK